jgi:hypothetical protein
MSKLVITLPDHLAKFAEQQAAAQHLSVDDFVGAVLEALRGNSGVMPLPVNVSPETLKEYLDLVAAEVAAGKICTRTIDEIIAEASRRHNA